MSSRTWTWAVDDDYGQHIAVGLTEAQARWIARKEHGHAYQDVPLCPACLDEGHEEPQSLEESGPFCARCGWTP